MGRHGRVVLAGPDRRDRAPRGSEPQTGPVHPSRVFSTPVFFDARPARAARCGGPDPDEAAPPGGRRRVEAEELLAALGARLEALEAAAREAELDALIIRHGARPGSNVTPFPVDRVSRRK